MEGWYNAHSGSLGEQTYVVRTEAGFVAAAGQQNPEDKGQNVCRESSAEPVEDG